MRQTLTKFGVVATVMAVAVLAWAETVVTPEEQLVQDLEALGKAATGADGSTVLWAAVLAAVFKVLISGLRMTGTWEGWWRGKDAKTALRIITVTLGLGTFLMSHLAMGKSWFEALVLGLAGPGAMVIHEYSKLFNKDKG